MVGVTPVEMQDGELLYGVDADGHRPGCWENPAYANHAAQQCASLPWPAAGVACSVHRRPDEQKCTVSRVAGPLQVDLQAVPERLAVIQGHEGRAGVAVSAHQR